MDLSTFADEWIRNRGLDDADSDYDGMIGAAVRELVRVFSAQGHSGGSAAAVRAYFCGLLADFNKPDSREWRNYWHSPAGRAFAAEHGLTSDEVIAAITRKTR